MMGGGGTQEDDDGLQDDDMMKYQQTLCVGQYKEDLAKTVGLEAQRKSLYENQNEISSDDVNFKKKKETKTRTSTQGEVEFDSKKSLLKTKLKKQWFSVWSTLHRWLGEDWIFLALLGMAMALCSYVMDYFMDKLNSIHLWLFTVSGRVNVGLQFFAWTSFTLTLVLFSAVTCHLIAPQAVGSGIPEMKTIMRGVVLKEYLTFRTLISKMIGLTAAAGSGIPMGKEGPFVHISSMVANLMSKMIRSFRGIYDNESRKVEMLAAACAVGVACTFGAPIGGVLFSIEVTSTYFAVRNYWRGFFAAVFSAIIFQLISIWARKEDTVVAFYTTSFRTVYPFDPKELVFYALVGVVCGFGGPLFVYTHRRIVLFIRENKYVKKFLSRSRFIYPAFIALLIGVLTFPPGYGQFICGALTSKSAINQLFSNFTWSDNNLNIIEEAVVTQWSPMGYSFYITLSLFTLYQFFCGILTNTIPIPVGVFIPVFLVGAGLGRISGELVAQLFPDGMKNSEITEIAPIVAGSYAVVGAAAFSGSVTHTISTSVIVFELTGQIVYIVPIMLAVLIANAIAAYLQPSIYDSVIRMKNLPYLPDILPTTSSAHNTMVQDFMVTNIKYISVHTTYGELKEFLADTTGVKAFPLVDSESNMILLGSIPRAQLETLVVEHVGERARKAEARKRHDDDIECSRENSECSATDLGPIVEGAPTKTYVQLRRRSVSDATLFHRFKIKYHHGPKKPLGRRSSHDDARRAVEAKEEEVAAETTFNNSLTSPQLSTFHKSLSVHSTLNAFHKIVGKLKHPTRHRHQKEGEYDLTEEESKLWKSDRLEEKLDFAKLRIDPAPFQLVEQTSLYKVHSLFSLLGLNRAYVTRLGRLVGVVATRQIREALQKVQTSYGTNNETFVNENVQLKEDKYSEGILPVSLQAALSNASVYSTIQKAREEGELGKSSPSTPKNLRRLFVPEIKVEMCDDNAHEEDNGIWFTGKDEQPPPPQGSSTEHTNGEKEACFGTKEDISSSSSSSNIDPEVPVVKMRAKRIFSVSRGSDNFPPTVVVESNVGHV